ncbi:MAG: tetratricopeptide repeat protein [Candidatus Omnitrophica bacterium]|nr:tetratricopeptide repeat protein [Candidatus Omnitrophota bacterium]
MMAKKIFKYVIILLGCAGILSSFVYSAGAQSDSQAQALFYKANESFQQGNYEQSEKIYQEILAAGLHSGSIYYNLGNAFFKQGQLGRAIVNYERAQRLLPQDSDVQANLQYALSLCNNSVVPLKQFWLISILKSIARHLPLDSWTMLLSGVYFLVLLFLAWFMLSKIIVLKKIAISLSCLLVLVSCLWLVKFQQIRLDKKAIIIVSEIDSRFAPAEDAVVHFKAYEGASIDIIDQNNAWVRIKTPDGKIGWVPESAIEKL